jgi:hypothetical protein
MLLHTGAELGHSHPLEHLILRLHIEQANDFSLRNEARQPPLTA